MTQERAGRGERRRLLSGSKRTLCSRGVPRWGQHGVKVSCQSASPPRLRLWSREVLAPVHSGPKASLMEAMEGGGG